MAETRPDHDHDRTQRVERERYERVVERPASAAPGGTNVNASTAPATTDARPMVWSVTRVVVLLFTVLEVILLLRFVLKLLGANANQPLVDGLYRLTEPMVRPFQGIFPNPAGTAFDLPALLAIVFFFLLAALIVAIVRAITGYRSNP